MTHYDIKCPGVKQNVATTQRRLDLQQKGVT